ncbi:MAG: tRNA (adenosine(37)-N6)-threonylcarbamoyltransferase complex dimerization subunit type 1 TsaB [Deltaproteobacteria bacterium]|nr:tRNA (adenosine(37)-N6)-threonylcarbamoyltransferase complex dimerization subunit type 1 TsaB [Deltaproteobacteria bacterium]
MAARRHVGGSGCPLLLAVETSCGTPSVALLRGEELLAEEQAAAGRSGAEGLLPCVDAVLRRAGLALEAVEAFAISIGPGSFTGLRIGVATLKGFAFGTELPIAPVPTLAVLARAAPDALDPVVALVDARRGEFYAAAYRLEGAGREPLPCEPAEGVYTPEQLAPRLPPACLLVGEGVALCGERLRALARSDVRLGPAAEPHARDVGILGARRIARGEAVAAAALLPHYVRRAEAEVKRTGQRFE